MNNNDEAMQLIKRKSDGMGPEIRWAANMLNLSQLSVAVRLTAVGYENLDENCQRACDKALLRLYEVANSATMSVELLDACTETMDEACALIDKDHLPEQENEIGPD